MNVAMPKTAVKLRHRLRDLLQRIYLDRDPTL